MTTKTWIAVDWGTSNMRAWVMSPEGAVRDRLRSDKGMGTLDPASFEPALLDLIAPYLTDDAVTPVICCGMAGAAQGWIEAPYHAVPAPPPGVAEAVRAPTSDPRIAVHILPGMKQDTPADVMRGEETQIAGYLSHDPGFDGVICLPGTHSKWVHISAGEVVSFRTFMTGELFALLAGQSVLRHSVTTQDWDEEAFSGGVRDAMGDARQIAAALFQLRAEGLLNGLPAPAARARLSGLLIGLELAGARAYWLGQRVVLIGEDRLCAHYAAALASQSATSEIAADVEFALAGLAAAYRGMMP